MKTRWYFGAWVNGWIMYGVWIRQRWFVGFAVVKGAAE